MENRTIQRTEFPSSKPNLTEVWSTSGLKCKTKILLVFWDIYKCMPSSKKILLQALSLRGIINKRKLKRRWWKCIWTISKICKALNTKRVWQKEFSLFKDSKTFARREDHEVYFVVACSGRYKKANLYQ